MTGGDPAKWHWENGGERCRPGRWEDEAQSEATVGKAKILNATADNEGAHVNVRPSSCEV